MTRILLLLTVLFVPVALGAQAFSSLSPGIREIISVPEGSVALTHVRVVDGTGAPPLEDRTIVVQNGKIASVSPAADARVPADARVLDLTGHTVIPGLVGMHNHTFYTTRG